MPATFARSKTFVIGEVLTAADLNGVETNILANFTPAGMDDYSVDVAAMRVTVDPYPVSVESLATSTQGEIERIRYLLAQITGKTYWYIDPIISLANLVIGTNVQAWDADLDAWALRTPPSGTVIGTTDTQTLTNKSLTDPKITTTINAQTGTTYTLVLTDASKLITLNNAAAITVTIPTNASVAFSICTQIDLIQIGAGKVTFAGAVGVTLNSKAGYKSIATQWVGVTLFKTATDTWNLCGDLIV